MKDINTPKNMMNAQTMEMLAKWWTDTQAREYLMNSRSQQIWALKKIKNKSFEANALELAEKNGRISYIEELLQLMKIAYEDIAKLRIKQNATNSKGKENNEGNASAVRQ